MSASSQPPVISAADAKARAAARGIAADELMDELLEAARSKAIVPVSGFAVGAVARGVSGALYLGANLEFSGHPLNASVHAEQAAVANAMANGERGIDALATTATPCGHCRQFLNELANAHALRILARGAPPATLGELLPASFGPAQLGVSDRLMDGRKHGLRLAGPSSDPLVAAALEAADASHAPYGKTPVGIALQLDDGTLVLGRYAESAAFNPSLSPLQAALSALALAGTAFDRIRAAALVETRGPASQRAATEALLATVAPGVVLAYARAV
ncbi:MAG TPA: cytidine deaminase [Candidatus Limnocylindrales bacterium]|nr:cytidine deaminase [Candidatus Limnocylindrales bacterium]